MRAYFLPRFIVLLLLGVIVGYMYPVTLLWSLPFIATWMVGVHMFGVWGFGRHYREYWFSQHAAYSFPMLFLYLGILIGAGKVGQFLIFLGHQIS